MCELFDRSGNKIDVREWVELFSDDDYRRIALTRIGDLIVSTIWLGIGNNDSGAPRFYETQVRGLHGDSIFARHPSFPRCQRWTNESDATAGHERTVELLVRLTASWN